MYTKGYNRIFWGMIIFIFHINLGYLTILPSCVGYMLIYSGLRILSSQNKTYKKGKLPAIILTILTLSDIWHDPNINILNLEPYNLQLATYLIGTLVIIINLYLIYIICKGVHDACTVRGLNQIMADIKITWKFYLGASLIVLFYFPFMINIPSDYNFYIIIPILLQMIMYLALAFIFKKCKTELSK